MAKFDLKCPTSHTTFACIAIALLYFFSGQLGMLVAIPGTYATAFWPPSGFALAATLVCGYGVCPGIFLGALSLDLFTVHAIDLQLYPLSAFTVSTITSLGACLQAATGAWLVKKFIHASHPFTRAVDVIKFCFLAIGSCLINATIGASCLAFSGLISWGFFSTVWLTWWIGDAVGILIITPLMIIWRHTPRLDLSLGQVVEVIALLASLALITYLNLFQHQLMFLFIPCLVWAALGFHLHGATAMNLLISIILVVFTVNGLGPFASLSTDRSLILLALFIVVVTIFVLSLTVEFSKPLRLVEYRWGGPSTTHLFRNFFKRWFSRHK